MKPSETQITKTIQLVKRLLAKQVIKKAVNTAQREGYTASLTLLEKRQTTYDGIEKLSTLQGRAIAVLASDYLRGECTDKVFLGVPIN